MSQPKHHHLLPRFYLEGFCNREVHYKEGHDQERSRCRVWTHDRETNEVRERGVNNLSKETHYYSAETPGGGLDPEPEKMLARVEDGAARVIKRLHYGSGLSSEEEVALATFMASMKFRVSSYRPWSQKYVADNETNIKRRAFPTTEALREGLRRHGRPEAEDPETVAQAFHDIHSGSLEIELTRNLMLENMLRHSQKVAEKLLELDWTFLWVSEGTSFATSDDPVLVLDSDLEAPEDFFGDVGFASPGATKVLPLNQDVCLSVGSGAHSVSRARLNRETVREVNLQQTRHYKRWLIARDEALVRRLVGGRSLRKPCDRHGLEEREGRLD